MIIDGVFASQAIDSSGEVLDIEGCDISTLDVDGVLNYEHKEGDKKGSGNNGEEIVGKIIYCRKILTQSDCENDRERMYWDEVKVPFIYGMARLYDGAGHSGAQALAAMIRDHHANKEKILVRYSIEGSTLERDPHEKNKLALSVARRVAATLKPCNRTAISGLVEDPKAPAGFDKKTLAEPEVTDLLAGLVEKGEEHPNYRKLGGAYETEVNPLVPEDMTKALSAGGYGAAPGSLTGGAALQVEDRNLKARAQAAVRDWGKRKFDKAEFKAFAKKYLPEADDSFVDHFADLAEDYHLKRGALRKTSGYNGPYYGGPEWPAGAPYPTAEEWMAGRKTYHPGHQESQAHRMLHHPDPAQRARALDYPELEREHPNTPEFHSWFGGSHVVDREGKPRVVFHGSRANFSSFDPSKRGAATAAPSANLGFFFSGRANTAEGYTNMVLPHEKEAHDKLWEEAGALKGRGGRRAKDPKKLAIIAEKRKRRDELLHQAHEMRTAGGNIMPVYLNLKNPLHHDMKGKPYREQSYHDIIQQAKAKGHDGVIIHNTFDTTLGDALPDNVYVAFHPHQIKSAMGNKGTFDPGNPDVTKTELVRSIENQVVKMEAVVIDLKKAVAEAVGEYEWQDNPVEFAGQHVIPGGALTATRKYALLHEDETHYTGVPEEKVGGWSASDLVRLPKSKEKTHFWVTSRPATVFNRDSL